MRNLTGVLSKSLLMAALVGSMSQPVYAAEFTPTLGDDSVYNVEEIEAVTDDSIILYDVKNVTKTYSYIDEKGKNIQKEYVTKEITPQYYKINVTGTSAERILNNPLDPEAPSFGDIKSHFINLDNYAINNYGKIDNITGDFLKNSPNSRLSATLYNGNGAMINDITGDFVSNQSTSNKYDFSASINNLGIINNINGKFINNKVEARQFITAGIMNNGEIGNINADFINNQTIAIGAVGYGNDGWYAYSAIYNDDQGIIGNITGKFINNTATANTVTWAGTILNRFGIDTITDSLFYKNTSNGYGGVFINQNNGDEIAYVNTINNSYFIDNKAKKGGAIYNSGGNKNIIYSIINSVFSDNKANNDAGAILNDGRIDEIIDSLFIENTAIDGSGGAIYNYENYYDPAIIRNITGDFVNNNAAFNGGAIYNRGTIGNITGNFIKNSAIGEDDSSGGAIFNIGYLNISNSSFIANDAATRGGAINNGYSYSGADDSILNITNSTFNNNTSGEYGGAIADAYSESIGNVPPGPLSLSLEENSDIMSVDAANNHLNISSSNFTKNSSKYGGAMSGMYRVYVYEGEPPRVDSISLYETASDVNNDSIVYKPINIDNSYFADNIAVKGGALYIDRKTYNIESDIPSAGSLNLYAESGSTIEESAEVDKFNLIIKNTNFIKNTAQNDADMNAAGGAIHTNANTVIIADNGNSIFQDNKVINNGNESLNDIYIVSNKGYVTQRNNEPEMDFLNNENPDFAPVTLTMVAKNGGIISFAGTIDGEATTTTIDDYGDEITEKLDDTPYAYNLVLTGDGTGKTVFNNSVINANITTEVGSNTYLAKDNNWDNNIVTLNGGTLSLLNNSSGVSALNNLTISGDTKFYGDVDLANKAMDRFTSNEYGTHAGNLVVSGLNLLSDAPEGEELTAVYFAEPGLKNNVTTGVNEVPTSYQTTAYTPIWKYNVSYDKENEYDNKGDGGYFLFARGDRNNSDSYNPSVLVTPTANLAAGQAALTEAYKYVFQHADTFTQLPSMERFAQMNANKYAINSDFSGTYSPLTTNLKNQGIWVRPYTSLETMNIKNGPKVDAITYGTLIGYDSCFREMKNGWHNVFTGYIGYNGSTLNYSGTDTSLNGGMLGFTETFYKGNFFTAVTASAGASVGQSTTMYGKEDFTTLLGGIGSKTGYNFEFKSGKFIIQPVMFMSYTFVNTFDYTNAAGVKIESDPMHTLQINPSVKFIGNLKNGWQPYGSVGMVWNLLNDTKVTANDIKLPEMSIKPYVEYGIGVQRNWGEKYTAFLQTMLRNGGRNGISFTGGFRMMVGEPKGRELHEIKKEIELTDIPEFEFFSKSKNAINIPI